MAAAGAFAAKNRAANGKEMDKGPEIPTIAAKTGDVQVVVNSWAKASGSSGLDR